jgi:hypothetical protein
MGIIPLSGRQGWQGRRAPPSSTTQHALQHNPEPIAHKPIIHNPKSTAHKPQPTAWPTEQKKGKPWRGITNRPLSTVPRGQAQRKAKVGQS